MNNLFNRLERLNWCSRTELVICSLVLYSVMSIAIVEYDVGKETVIGCLFKTICSTLASLFVQRILFRLPKYIWLALKWLIAEFRVFINK